MITTHLLSPNFGTELDHKLTLVSLSDADVEALQLEIAQAGGLGRPRSKDDGRCSSAICCKIRRAFPQC